MNTIHRTVWNHALGAWVAAPETARSRRKGGVAAKRMAVPAALAAVLWLGVTPGWAAGGAGGVPGPTFHGGSGGSAGAGGEGALNNSSLGASGGSGGSASSQTVTGGSDAVIGSFGGATAGTGGVAGSAPGEDGAVGQSQASMDGYGGGGGAGNHGYLSTASSDVTLSTPHAGGNGGAGGEGYWAAGGGGAGGYGAMVSLLPSPSAIPTVNQQATLAGGAGGAGGNASSQAGGGGSGGAGIQVDAGGSSFALINAGTIAGGAGGAGGAEVPGIRNNASGGGGGEGGAGAVLVGAATVTNAGSIVGGAGGAGGAGGGGAGGIGQPGGGGDGGVGMLVQGNAGATVINNEIGGNIAGGAGGAGGLSSNNGAAGANGVGGVGIQGANLQINNSGTISGGLGGNGSTRAAAVQFTGGSNTLALRSGSVINGRVDIGSGATGLIQSQAAGLSMGDLALGGAATLDAGAGNSLEVAGTVSGSGALSVTGAGTVALTAANTYSGGTSVNGGNLRIASAQALGSGAVSVSGGSLTGTADLTIGSALSLSGAARLGAASGTTMNVTSVVSLAGGTELVIGSTTDTGVVNASGGSALSSPFGTLRVAGGTLMGSTAGFWSANMSSTTIDAGATLDFGSSAGSVLNLQGAGKVQAGADLFVGAGSFSGEISGAGTLVKNGAGTLALSGSNTYTGGTELKGGRLNLGSNGALGSGELAMDDGTTLGFTADGLNIANNIRMTGTNDPVIDTGSFSETLSGTISGGGLLTKQGSGTLTLAGANNYTGATDVAAGTLRAGAAGTFSAASVHNVAAGATLDLAGFSQTVAGVSNAGTVSLVGSAPGTTLTVNGAWVGNNGTLRMGTALGDSTSVSDRLVLSGAGASASGTTNVQITNLGGLGGLTSGSGIEVISATNGATTTAQTTKSAFVLAGGHVDAGAYEYRLHAADAAGAGENWYLRSTTTVTTEPPITVTPPTETPPTGTPPTETPATPPSQAPSGSAPGSTPAQVPTYRVEVPLFAAVPGQFREVGLAMVGNLHQRVGDDATNASGPRQAWGRIISINRDISQGGTVDPRSEGRLDGFQAGTDLWANPAWRTGVYVGQLDGDMDVNGFARGVHDYAAGSNDLRGQFLGAYATWNNGAGLYVDGVLQGGRLRYDVNPNGAAASSGKGNSVLGSIEVGQAFPIAPGWTVEPQLQLVGQHVDLDDVTISGARIQQDTDDAWLLRVGVRVRGDVATGNGLVQPYARVNLYSGKGGTDITRFIGPAAFTDIATATGGTRVELAVGASWHLSPALSLYGEIGNLWDVGGAVRTDGGLNGSLGMKIRW